MNKQTGKKEGEAKLCKRKEGMTDRKVKSKMDGVKERMEGRRMMVERNKWSKELKMGKVRKAKLHKIMEGMSNKGRQQKGRRKKGRTER